MMKTAGMWVLLLALVVPSPVAAEAATGITTIPVSRLVTETPEVTPTSDVNRNNVETRHLHPFAYDVILIDVGHGGIDGGTSYGTILEKDINLAISRRLFMLLRQEGYHCVLNRDADYALSDDNRWHRTSSRHRRDLSQRKQLSKELPTKMVVSVHVNWGKNPSKGGGIVLHQAEGRSTALAAIIQDQLNQVYRNHNTIMVGKPYYLLNTTDVPAVIVETGFLIMRKTVIYLRAVMVKCALPKRLQMGLLAT